MGMTHNVSQALAELGAGERIQLLRRMGIEGQFDKPLAPHQFIRQVSAHVVTRKLTDEFFTAYDEIKGRR